MQIARVRDGKKRGGVLPRWSQMEASADRVLYRFRKDFPMIVRRTKIVGGRIFLFFSCGHIKLGFPTCFLRRRYCRNSEVFIDTAVLYLLSGLKEKRFWIFYPYIFNILIFRAEEFLLRLTARLFDVKRLLWEKFILY